MLDDETMEGSHWNLIRATALDFEPEMEKENDEKAGITEERQCNDMCVRLNQANEHSLRGIPLLLTYSS